MLFNFDIRSRVVIAFIYLLILILTPIIIHLYHKRKSMHHIDKCEDSQEPHTAYEGFRGRGFSHNYEDVDSPYSQVHASTKNILTDFLTYSNDEPVQQTWFSTLFFTLIGNHEVGERGEVGEEGEERLRVIKRDTTGEKEDAAISKYKKLKENLQFRMTEDLFSQNDFILFFDKPDFKGKMYLLPAGRAHEWKSKIFKPKEYLPRPSFIEMNNLQRVLVAGSIDDADDAVDAKDEEGNMEIEAFEVGPLVVDVMKNFNDRGVISEEDGGVIGEEEEEEGEGEEEEEIQDEIVEEKSTIDSRCSNHTFL